MKIIVLYYQNIYIEFSSLECQNFLQHYSLCLNILHNHFGPTKLFWKLHLAVDISAKHFFRACRGPSIEIRDGKGLYRVDLFFFEDFSLNFKLRLYIVFFCWKFQFIYDFSNSNSGKISDGNNFRNIYFLFMDFYPEESIKVLIYNC